MHSPDILDAETPAGGILIIAAGGIGDAILLAHLFPRFAGLAEDGEPVTLILRADAGKAAFLFSGLAQVLTVNFGRLRSSFRYRRRVFQALTRQLPARHQRRLQTPSEAGRSADPGLGRAKHLRHEGPALVQI